MRASAAAASLPLAGSYAATARTGGARAERRRSASIASLAAACGCATTDAGLATSSLSTLTQAWTAAACRLVLGVTGRPVLLVKEPKAVESALLGNATCRPPDFSTAAAVGLTSVPDSSPPRRQRSRCAWGLQNARLSFQNRRRFVRCGLRSFAEVP
jgi:hypothetical protein